VSAWPRPGPRAIAFVLVAALLLYFALLAGRAWWLLTSGRVVLVLLGIGVLLLPVVAAVLVAAEIRFGFATQRLGERLAAEGGLPADDLPRRPSGRVDRAAADEVFARRRAEAEAAPDDWRSWFRLGIAYDDAGDRGRAREALRRAIALAAADG
jgi:cytochrome c-type biogenesis protein CcmH/NrfG